MASDRAKRVMARYRSLQDRGVEQGVESVVYRPLGGKERTIDAIVTRKPAEPIGGGASSPVIELDVLNDTTLGIASATINRGGDLIDVAEVRGQAAGSRQLNRILGQDGDWLTIEAR